jgi:hypothetical protein
VKKGVEKASEVKKKDLKSERIIKMEEDKN